VRCACPTRNVSLLLPAWIRLFLGWVRRAGGMVLAVVLAAALASGAVRADPVSLDSFELARGDEGLVLSFAARFELSKPIEEALQKGVPLFFVAQAEVFRDRWYWADRRLANATRSWRLAYQPLTRKYRVTYGGLSQHYDNLSDALVAVSRSVNWKLVDASQLDDGKHYVEFSYQLDTAQMPRPMQIGIGGQSDWSLKVERTRRLN
jgi:hypothetical protein